MGDVLKMDRNGKQTKGKRLSLRQVVAHNQALVAELTRLKASHDKTIKYVCVLATRDAERNGRCVIEVDELAKWAKGDGVDYEIDGETRRIVVKPRMQPKEVKSDDHE